MNAQLCGSRSVASALFGAWMLLSAPAPAAQTNQIARAESSASQVSPGDSLKPDSASPQRGNGNRAAKAGDTQPYSLGVDDILKMARAGVSADVIKAYVENSPIAYSLKAADIIALKEQGVPDDITKALVKRGAELHLQVGRSLNAMNNRRYYNLDPESYDYFQYYYLYPRTLAAANQRLFSSSTPFFGPSSAPYSYWGPLHFQPFPHTFFRGP